MSKIPVKTGKHKNTRAAVSGVLLAAAMLLAVSGCGTRQNAAISTPSDPVDATAQAYDTADIPEHGTTASPSPSFSPSPQATVTPPALAEPEPEIAASPSPVGISDETLVTVTDYIPDIYVDLKYAGEDNFTGTVIYDFTQAQLRYGTVKKLMEVQQDLSQQGYSLKIWDAYRPVSAQFKLWEICPDPAYVANPTTGYSSHSRGSTLDVTLVMADGTEIEMPTGFDDFSAQADRDYSDVSETAAANARILESTMSEYGFVGYYAEWWHFSDSTEYPVIQNG